MVGARALSHCAKFRCACWMLVGPVVGELHVDPEIARAQQRHYFLQGIAILAGNAHQIPLDGRLDLLLAILDRLHDVARLLDGDALLQADLLPHARSSSRSDGPVDQTLQRNTTLDQLLLQDLGHGLEAELVAAVQDDLVLFFL